MRLIRQEPFPLPIEVQVNTELCSLNPENFCVLPFQRQLRTSEECNLEQASKHLPDFQTKGTIFSALPGKNELCDPEAIADM